MKNNQYQSKLRTIYWDVDDVAINSLETCVNIINEKYNIPNHLPIKTIKDARDWNMKSIYKDLTREQLEDIFASDRFWSEINIRKDFLNIFTKPILRSYSHFFVTKGNEENLTKKQSFLSKSFPYYDRTEFIGMPAHTSKGNIDMSDGILVDDNIKNLIESNAGLKILLTNNLETCYNNAFGDFSDEDITDIYIVNTLDQVKDILDFNLKYDINTLR